MADIRKRLSLRAQEDGVLPSLQKVQEAELRRAEEEATRRLSGEELPEYVRRVSNGKLKVLAVETHTKLLNELSAMRSELDAVRDRGTVVPRGTISIDRPPMDRALPHRVQVPFYLGPMHGRILQVSGSATMYVMPDQPLSAADVRDLARGAIFNRQATATVYNLYTIERRLVFMRASDAGALEQVHAYVALVRYLDVKYLELGTWDDRAQAQRPV